MSNLPPDDIATHIEQVRTDSIRRRRRGWRLIGGVVGGFVLLLVAVPLLMYLYLQARGQSLLRAELAKIKATGEPITTAEMEAYHVVTPGQSDITQLWTAALAPFDEKPFDASAMNVPLVDKDANKPPPFDEPLSAEDEQTIREWLALHKKQIDSIYAAAKQEGAVRYPRNFGAGLGMLSPEVWQAGNAWRALDLEFEILARQDNAEACLDNLRTRIAILETFRDEPDLLSFVARITSHDNATKDIQALAATGKLNDGEMATLQLWLRGIEIHGKLHNSLLSDRAAFYHAFHIPGDIMAFNGPKIDPFVTTYDCRRVNRAEDCAMFLRLSAEMLESASQAFPHSLESSDRIMERVKQMGANKFDRSRYAATLMYFQMIPEAAWSADARITSVRDLTDAALAVHRYQLQHHRLPTSWNDLIPDLLPRTPVDPFTGKVPFFVTKTDRVLLYSVGKDRNDDGGKTDDGHMEPDIAVEVLKR